MHLTPAGFPLGMPGIGLEIDGAMQHAPQPGRHSIFIFS
jgi:elongation factor P